jgi:hypothetical protein
MEHLSNSHQEWYEWTSSYLKAGGLTSITGGWDTSLDPTIHFLIRGGIFDLSGVLELESNSMDESLLYSADNLGFRCASN